MIEKKVTLAVIVAVIAQAGGVFLWAGSASARLAELETRVAAQADISERMARVEVKLELVSAQLGRMERKMDEQREAYPVGRH
jgi:uncharacterized coiled-coil protein SlyX